METSRASIYIGNVKCKTWWILNRLGAVMHTLIVFRTALPTMFPYRLDNITENSRVQVTIYTPKIGDRPNCFRALFPGISVHLKDSLDLLSPS